MERTVNPAMLILAREARGWNQSELADRIGVGQGTISKYENRMMPVSESDLLAISRETGYTPDFFIQTDQVHGIGNSYLFHRKRQSAPVAVQKRLQARVNILRMQIERLLRATDLRSVNSFEVCDPAELGGDAEAAARTVRAAWRIPFGPIANVTQCIENAGGIVLKCDFDTNLIDAAHFWLPGMPPLFFVNDSVPGDRLRFTLAHEIGHAVMHRGYVGENVEDEANRFAAEFLMPADEVRPHLYNLNLERAAALKPVWKVSMAAIIRRAHSLGCITPSKYKNLNVSMSSQGYKKNEPYPVPVEEPKLARTLVASHYCKDG